MAKKQRVPREEHLLVYGLCFVELLSVMTLVSMMTY